MAIPLNTVEELLNRINGIDSSNLRQTLYKSLAAATMHLQSQLRLTKFDALVAQTDEFTIDRTNRINSRWEDRFIKFRFRNGFVDETTNIIQFTYGLTVDELNDATVVDPKFLRLDLETGFLEFDVFEFRDSFLPVHRRYRPEDFRDYVFRCVYDSGFPLKSTADGKVFDGVPDWLAEAALVQAREIYQLTNPSKDNDSQSAVVNLDTLLAPHVRIFVDGLDALTR